MSIAIKKIKLHFLNMTLNEPFTTSFGTLEHKRFFITEVIDHDGNRGYGESVAFESPWYTEETMQTNIHIIEDFLIPLLQQHEIDHPDSITTLFQPIRGNKMAKAAIEGAIWDLYSKKNNISLSDALGGTKEKIDVGIAIGIKPTMNEQLESIEQALQDGYKRIKIKIKRGWDVEVLQEIRHHFPHIELMADANSAYTLKDTEHLQQLDQFNLMMIEQPLAHDDIIDHATLQEEIKTPICLDESIHSLEDTRRAIELGSCHIINVKIGRVGGLTEAKRIHDYCEANKVPIWCGGMLEAGIGRAHNIALTSLSQFTLPGDTAGSAHYWKKDIITPEVISENGEINVPKGPGIGYELDEAALKQFTVEKRVFTFDE